MHPPRLQRSRLVVVAAVLLASPAASAQIPPTSPTPTPGPTEKADGVAEQAPKTAGKLPTIPVLPPPEQPSKRYQLFQLDGYFRWRGDWLKKFDLGFSDDPVDGGAPFPNPLGCRAEGGECDDTIKSSNIRLRLEPVINLGERAGTTKTASVHMQIDVVDNLVLGSTPTGFFSDGTAAPGDMPIGAFSNGQAPAQAGRNSTSDSLVVRRAWAQIWTPFGQLKVGRQPSHWGMGVLTNAGGRDPIHGGYDLDSDYGDTVDRLIFNAEIPGTNLRGAIGTDWSSSQPAASQTNLFSNRTDGQPFDLDDNDDLNQWVFAISRLDDPETFQETIDDDALAVNYGAYFLYRTQDFAHNGTMTGAEPALDQLVSRGLTAYIPDVWVRLAYKALELEVEAAGMVGEIGDLSDLGLVIDPDEDAPDIRAFGGVGKLTYKLLDDDLRLTMEVGYASGDDFDNEPAGRTHVSNSALVPSPAAPVQRTQADDFTAFRFNFDYEIDLILFRELIGTVTNTTYFRPQLAYEITNRIRMKVQSVISLANKRAATPGNDRFYGVEFDGDLGYQNGGFFAGIAYGVLFPLGALDHSVAAGFPMTTSVPGRSASGEADTAQTIQFRLMLKF